MGKGRPRAVEKGKRGGHSSCASSCSSLNLPPAPVYYPTEVEFKDPLEYIDKIRPEAELYGICRIVPPHSWKPPFALDLDSFTFPTKTQAIHQLQLRPACDSKTFELEYNSFLEEHCGKKSNKRVVFDGKDLDLCKLFNAVKRYGGYEKVVKEKRWGDVFRFVRLDRKIPECSKHVLCQIYREHLYDYEGYYNQLNDEVTGKCKKILDEKVNDRFDVQSCKRRRINVDNERVKKCSDVQTSDLDYLDQICEQCKIGSHGEVMLLCDRCNKGWHIYCLSPPLMGIPPGNWYCLECLNSDKDRFGFMAGKYFSLEAFRRVADRSKKKWFGSMPSSLGQIEKKFWEVVEGLIGEVEVMYGSDLDTSVYGSGFPRIGDTRPQSVDAELWDIYCSSPWNLNNLPKLRGSMLRAVHQNIEGVMVPWLYIGMLFSSFCWHFEDHCFYSMNYLHWGEPKCWYSIPGNKAYAFEKVMRNNLPDLFDAQPDLLFQLVTMLNPSVLQKDNVPVYSILQEPGNFVITFPRSYHGGFNLGLNCAEAVNFAPADWLPHGGIGAGLYQLYHKPAVLSHEELLCVVAKSDFDSKASAYLKKELYRIYSKEKILREKLWRSGIVNSSPLTVRKNVDFVDTEEDSTCIICQQYLYLSAVACCCKPSAFACLEHWEHICECKSSKHQLLYRYTLAELSDLVRLTYKFDFTETLEDQNLQMQLSCSDDSAALTKKVKGVPVSHVELAQAWIVHSRNLFRLPFSSTVFENALKEAEQFIWAGSEMDLVRDIAKNLINAKEWAEGIRSCVSKVENWLSHRCSRSEKVQFKYVDKLLSLNPKPCNESGHLKLKEHLEVARLLIHEIDSALSNCSEISSLENLFDRVIDLPILLEESEQLEHKISSAKVCRDNVRCCILESSPSAVEIDMLYKLKLEILEFQIILPEADILLDMLRQAESCGVQCSEVVGAPMSLKKVEEFLQQFDGFTVNVPELTLLRQYYCDAVSWISRFNNISVNVHEPLNQENVVDELNGLLKDGASLMIHVDELFCVEVELKKARCREKAHKILHACDSKKPLHIIQNLLSEAVTLEIDKEKLFLHIYGLLEAVVYWEDKALHVLGRESQMSDFEDVIRASDSMCAILPSLSDVKDAVSMAKSWLEKSKPFLATALSLTPTLSSLLNVEALKDLESESRLLKVSLAERSMLQTILQNCMEWEQSARFLLENAKGLFQLCNIENEISSELIKKIEYMLADVDSVTKDGCSLGYDFVELPELHNLHSTLRWCFQALSLRSNSPSLQEVELLAEVSENLPIMWISSVFLSSLIDSVRWMRKALEIVVPYGVRKCKLSDAEDLVVQSQILKVPFPETASQLVNVIKKHNVWLEQVHDFFTLKIDDRPLSILLELQDIGKLDAFDCPELNGVFFEAERVEKWKLRCVGFVGHLVGDMNSLHNALTKIKYTLDKTLIIYDKSKHYKMSDFCICCYGDCNNQDCLTCLICKDCFHWRCMKLNGDDLNDVKHYMCKYTCPYCLFVSSGSVAQNGGVLLKYKERRCELRILAELLADALDFPIQLEERVILGKIVEQTLACSDYLMEMADFSLCFQDKDIRITYKNLSTALKAVSVSKVYDQQAYCKLDLALARNAWKVRADKQINGSQKLSIQQIQRLLKEGEVLSIAPEDHFLQKLTKMKCMGLQWADTAKKVASDSGEVELEKVFELIMEGEKLDVHFEKELKLLRSRSMLYCICRKPYDRRPMIACDQCDEWYHFDCVRLSSAPKIYICPACIPHVQLSAVPSEGNQRSCGGGKTQASSSPKARKKVKVKVGKDLLWRNRKAFRRNAKKRVELQCLAPF